MFSLSMCCVPPATPSLTRSPQFPFALYRNEAIAFLLFLLFFLASQSNVYLCKELINNFSRENFYFFLLHVVYWSITKHFTLCNSHITFIGDVLMMEIFRIHYLINFWWQINGNLLAMSLRNCELLCVVTRWRNF